MKSIMLCMLIAMLALTVGCSTKTVIVEPIVSDGLESMDEQVNAAIQQITDGRIFFAFDKFDITPQYQDMLQQKAEMMKIYPSIRVRIEGNCDDRGTQEYNLALGERRARAAYDYLVRLGVNPMQLEMISFGKERPLVYGSTTADMAQNRRDEFRVISY